MLVELARLSLCKCPFLAQFPFPKALGFSLVSVVGSCGCHMPLGDRSWGKGDEGVAPSFLTCCFLTVPSTRFSLLGSCR